MAAAAGPNSSGGSSSKSAGGGGGTASVSPSAAAGLGQARMRGVYLGCMENRGGFFPIRDPASKWWVIQFSCITQCNVKCNMICCSEGLHACWM